MPNLYNWNSYCAGAPKLGVWGRKEREERNECDSAPGVIMACDPTSARGRPGTCVIQAQYL